ncbi:MAG: phosphatase PAP2 family protein [Phycisphaerales bacterium]|nr:phosphatase PAP2 family protein [Phycisphaerales bacterium]
MSSTESTPTSANETPCPGTRLGGAELGRASVINPRAGKRRWGLRIVLALAAAAVLGALFVYDVPLMRWRYAVIGEEVQEPLANVLISFRDFTQIVTSIAILIVVGTYDRRRWAIIGVFLLAQFFAKVGYDSGKHLLSRYRPGPAIARVAPLDELSNRQTWIGWRQGDGTIDTQSFPSGHSAAAFASALVLAWFYPRIAWLLWIMAIGCAVSRYLDAVHWPSDCWTGIFIGYLSARLALRIYLRFRPDPDSINQ